MTIGLTLSYTDIQALLTYSESLIKTLNLIVEKCLIPSEKAKCKAYLSELVKCHNKLNLKNSQWPILHKNKKLRKINITYTQGYIYWIYYNMATHPIVINDKISFIAQQLTL